MKARASRRSYRIPESRQWKEHAEGLGSIYLSTVRIAIWRLHRQVGHVSYRVLIRLMRLSR
eukprot:8187184-Pyramimonas_sp.AAC.1